MSNNTTNSLVGSGGESTDSLSSSASSIEATTNTANGGKTAQTHKDKHSVTKRLQQELLSLMMSGEKGVSAFPDGDNLFKWIGTIQGPVGTVTIL